MPPNHSLISPALFFTLLLIQILFGVNYVFSKQVILQLPPLLWASIRSTATACGLFLICLLLKRLDPLKALKEIKSLLGLALLAVTLNQACFLLGLKYTTPTNSALLNTLIPIFTFALATFAGQEKLNRLRALGFVSAFAGVLTLHHIESYSFSNTTLIGDSLTLGNALFYSCFLAFGRMFLVKNDFLWAITWVFILGSLLLLPVGLWEWSHFESSPYPGIFWFSALYGIIGGTLIPYLLIGFTLGRARSSTVALFIYFQPLIAATLSYLWLGEQLSERALISALFIFLGVFLATRTSAPITYNGQTPS